MVNATVMVARGCNIRLCNGVVHLVVHRRWLLGLVCNSYGYVQQAIGLLWKQELHLHMALGIQHSPAQPNVPGDVQLLQIHQRCAPQTTIPFDGAIAVNGSLLHLVMSHSTSYHLYCTQAGHQQVP